MNISSASKKVLCTALSAATALAFTPAVAFGAIDEGTAVKVTFNLNGGKVDGDVLVGSDTGIGYVEATAGKVDIPATYAKSDEYNLYSVGAGTEIYKYSGDGNEYVEVDYKVETDGFYSDEGGTPVSNSGYGLDYYVLPSDTKYYTMSDNDGKVDYIPVTYNPVYVIGSEAKHVDNGLDLRGTDAMRTGVAAKGGNAIAGWFVDADGDGVKDEGETAVEDGILNVSGDDVSGSEVELTAYYAEPALEPALQATSVTGEMAVSAATLDATGLEAGAKYDAELTFPDGTSVTAPDTVPANGNGTATFDFAAALSSVKDAMTAGEYTFSVRKNGNGETVATGTAKLVAVKLDAGDYGSFGRNAVTEFVATPGVTVTLGSENKPSTDGGYPLSGWTDGENGYGASEITVYADAELTAVYAVPQVDGIGFGEHYYGCTVADGTLAFSAKNLADAGDTGKYTATITGPEGFSKTIDVTVDGEGATSGSLKFGEAWETANEVTEALAAGTYTVTVELEAVNGEELTEDQKGQGAVAGSVELAPISYELNGGSWASPEGVAELPTLAAVGSKVYGYGDGSDESASYVLGNDAFTAPEGMEVDCVTVNGVKSDEVAGETVPASGVTVAAVYKKKAATQAAAPEVTFEEAEDGSYTASVTAAEGTRAYYIIDSGDETAVPDDGTVTLGNAEELTVWSVDTTDSDLDKSEETVYTPAAATINRLKAFGDAVADGLTSASAKNAPVRYGDEIEGLGEAAVEAAKAKAWGSASEWKALTDEQERAILEQAVEVEENNLEALTQPKLSEDGETYTYVSAADAAEASEALALVLTDFDGLRSGETYDAKSTTNGTNVVTDNAGDYIEAIAYAVSSAKKTTVGSTDAAAAAAVDALIQALPEVTDDNYEAAIEAADEAIAAYGALSDAARALVTEDVERTHEVKIAALEKKVAAAEKAAEQAKADAAAEQAKAQKELEEAEAALVAEQDHASALQVKGKTKAVKANKKTKKTKKAVSYTIVAEQSPSGAVATFSTVSKTSKVKVSGAKVTLKKGAKKGKTYSAKVKVSYGNASNTVTVKFKVK